ncbi:molecular chaperone [Achromobacter seleniivolatilans]|uniref:Molecular chaperone n=1 Tax=Achromobacter seleniivolatilans TaxID=3047478 RepID=A0ABY9M1D8_9BURK|nr:molecular chaperone [Achromobacter sp. R39]WMD20811.1 molecular chaperone [Achromobacter sp. R39]
MTGIRLRRLGAFLLVLGLACLQAAPASANVVILGTRVIYHAKDKEVTVQLQNESSVPALVQAWVSQTMKTQGPDGESVPFVVVPPMARISPSRGQAMRLSFTGADLPQDRESLFWFNLLDVPGVARSPNEAKNELQLAYKSQVKLFYRPTGLSGSLDDAVKALKLKMEGGKLTLQNDSPFHISLVQASFNDGTRLLPLKSMDSVMIVPFGARSVDVKAADVRQAKSLDIIWVNDYGAAQNLALPLAETREKGK